jgi:citrate lyase beta subunit
VFYARSAVLLHAKAAGLQSIATPFVDLNDITALTADARRALTMGYTGKLAIHPRQVEPIQQVFTPSAEEISRARRLIDAHAAQQAAGSGVFELDGKMVDMPMVRAAESVLARARAAGLNIDKND